MNYKSGEVKTFEGKTVLITGASAGIGKVFAEKLAAQKAKLLLVARREQNLEKLAAELREKHGAQVDYFKSDLSRHDSPWNIFEWVRSKDYQIDCLINNAGFGAYGSFDTMPREQIQAMINVNVSALVELTRIFLPEIKARKGGLIQVASTASFQPIPFLSVYAATKSFVRSFSEALWAENRDIRVLCLCPGNTESEFHDTAGIHQKKVFLRATTEELVDFALHKYQNSNHPTHVHGNRNSIVAFSTRFSPTRLALWIARKIYEMRTGSSH